MACFVSCFHLGQDFRQRRKACHPQKNPLWPLLDSNGIHSQNAVECLTCYCFYIHMHCWPAMLICFVSQIQNLVKFYSCARCFAHFLAALSPPFLAVHVQKRGSKILQFCIFSFFFLICRVCCSITLFQAKDWPQIIACFVGMLCMLCKRRLQKMHVLICFFGCLPCMLFKQIFTNRLQQHPAFLQRFGANQSLQATRP